MQYDALEAVDLAERAKSALRTALAMNAGADFNRFVIDEAVDAIIESAVIEVLTRLARAEIEEPPPLRTGDDET